MRSPGWPLPSGTTDRDARHAGAATEEIGKECTSRIAARLRTADAVFGSPWLDGPAMMIFAAMAVGPLARLVVAPHESGHGGRADAVAHSTMAAGVAAMALPAADPVPQWGWLVAFASVASWFAGRLLHLGPASGTAGPAMGRRAWRRRAGPAAHQPAGSMLMIVATARRWTARRPWVRAAIRLPLAPGLSHSVAHFAVSACTHHGEPGASHRQPR